MAITFSDIEINRFRLQAKHRSSTENIKLSMALDAVANNNGYSNWSLLMKHASPKDDGAAAVSMRQYFRFTRTVEEMQQAMRKVVDKTHSYSYRQQETPAERLTAEIVQEFVDAANAVDFVIAFMECLLSVKQFRLHAESQAYAEMRWWLPYELATVNKTAQVLVNRKYKPIGLRTKEWSDHENYPHLAMSLSANQLLAVAHRPSSSGYLFGDGSAPWLSRQNAERYLERLQTLRGFIKGS